MASENTLSFRARSTSRIGEGTIRRSGLRYCQHSGTIDAHRGPLSFAELRAIDTTAFWPIFKPIFSGSSVIAAPGGQSGCERPTTRRLLGEVYLRRDLRLASPTCVVILCLQK